MVGGSESHETAAEIEASPPSYEDICPRPMPGTYLLPAQPGLAISGKSYRENEQRLSMSFGFCPDPSNVSLNQDWVAILMVKCHNVPRLMREGFHWDAANVIREEAYVDQDFTFARFRQDRKCWAGTRHYFLKDLQQPPRWIATIEVFALNQTTLFQFKLNKLSRETTKWATANNQSGHQIYHWHRGFPDSWFNVVYDDMPMEGWWPWPKRNQAI
ncbi:hypothetical protein FHL15_002894 [Xylaria flabelliformis]|uniref:Uncharacterized protein n=1 Tax=Xylaria flabelliformis TaxID=2512241 RepID=A0A553I7I7_9PEZI|nr:hypothetical protein FHL15_002894 [Xylaria flabelliformis]